jgi:hypothetical protein
MDENQKKYNCRYCNKILGSIKSRWCHEKTFHKELKTDKKTVNENSENKCIICNKIFATKGSLKRHCNNICTSLNNKQIQTNNSGNIIIINNIQNQQNNNMININPYNNPNIESLNLVDICNIFDEEFNMVLKLIEITYFNNKLEENHSFYVSNLKGDHVNTLTTTKLKKYFFDELFSIILVRIKNLYDKYKNRLFEFPKQIEIQEKIQALEDMRNENNHTYKSYLKLMNILAYDKKDLVINSWTKVKPSICNSSNDNNDEIVWDLNV